MGLQAWVLPITFADGVDQDIAEIQKAQQQNNATYDSLNRMNPMNAQNKLGQPQDPPAPPPPIANGLDQLEKILSHPIVQSAYRFVSNPQVKAALEQILKSPNRIYIFYIEIAWFIFFLLFRAWRGSKLESYNWIRAIFLKLWTLAVYLIVGSTVVPWIVLGDPYAKILIKAAQTLGWMK